MMSEKKYTFSLDTNKILTAVAIAVIMGGAKIGFDVWAGTKVIPSMAEKIKEHDERFLTFRSTLDNKADKVEIQRVEKKVDKILTILCTMNNKPTDCAN